MPETTFLQIQGRGDTAARMLEMPPGPVRIGRGSHCEVRLGDDPGLGDVQCLLRRRGTHWHFQPVGPPGHVWIDGHPADQQQPLPVGTSLQVGDHWLTLRSTTSPAETRGSFATPISVEPRVETPPTPAEPTPPPTAERARPAAPTTTASPTSSTGGTADDEDRLRRWQTRLEQRERWLKSRQDERTWEARWKAAGETIRGRAASNPPGPSAPTPPPARPSTAPPTPSPTHLPRDRRPMGRTADRAVEPRPVAPAPLQRPAEPSRVPPPARVPVRTAEPPASIRDPLPPRTPIVAPAEPVRPTPPPTPPVARIIEPSRELAPVVAPTPEPDAEPVRVTAVVVVPEPESPAVSVVAEPEDIIDIALEPIAVADPEPEVEEPVAEAVIEFRSEPEPLVSVPVMLAPVAEPETSPEPVPSTALEREPEFATESEPEVEARAFEPLAPEADWPSAQAIFAGRTARSVAGAEAAAALARTRPEVGPRPSAILAPAKWHLPAWLAAPVLTLTVLAGGAAGTALAWFWTTDALSMNEAVRLALRPDTTPPPIIDAQSIPRRPWWQTTPGQLSAWAVAVERSADGGSRLDEARALASDARHASPLGASARFVMELPAPAGTEGGPSPDASLGVGRGRDVVTMAWTGNRLRREGKVEAATRAYRTAFDLACRSGGDVPRFMESIQPRRYTFRHEALSEWVAKEILAAGPWTAEQWLEVLPPFTPALIAASRAVRPTDRAVADRLIDHAATLSGEAAPHGFDEAEHQAAGAVALSERARWSDAMTQYRRAIERTHDTLARRTWWINLAEVAGRASDEATRTEAFEAAMVVSDHPDEITKRARKGLNLNGIVRKP